MLVCRASSHNSKVGCGVSTSNNESYNEDEGIRRALEYVEHLTSNTNTLRLVLPINMNGIVFVLIIHCDYFVCRTTTDISNY